MADRIVWRANFLRVFDRRDMFDRCNGLVVVGVVGGFGMMPMVVMMTMPMLMVPGQCRIGSQSHHRCNRETEHFHCC